DGVQRLLLCCEIGPDTYGAPPSTMWRRALEPVSAEEQHRGRTLARRARSGKRVRRVRDSKDAPRDRSREPRGNSCRLFRQRSQPDPDRYSAPHRATLSTDLSSSRLGSALPVPEAPQLMVTSRQVVYDAERRHPRLTLTR